MRAETVILDNTRLVGERTAEVDTVLEEVAEGLGPKPVWEDDEDVVGNESGSSRECEWSLRQRARWLIFQ